MTARRLLLASLPTILLCLSQGIVAQSVAIQKSAEDCQTELHDDGKTADLKAKLAARMAELKKPPAIGEDAKDAGTAAAEQQKLNDAMALLEAAATTRSQAQGKLDVVKRARNTAEAQVALREAQDMTAYARKLERQAEVISHVERPDAADSGITGHPGVVEPRRGTAFAQLVGTESQLSAGKSGAAAYEGARIADWDEGAAQLQLEGGKRLDVRPLLQSFRQVAGPAVPLFRPVPSPNSDGRQEWRLSDEAMHEFRDPGTRARLDQVGGVDLSVTLDLLEFNELEDFRKSGPALIVGRPVLISLKRLVTEAENFAGSWNSLPDDLRFPGGIERIVGFVIGADGTDIVLVGAPASLSSRRIDLDSLIVGVRSAWRDGQVPSVSLDPLPQDPGGPQFTQVSGVPRNSRFARIMIDADYEMKRIMGGQVTIDVPGYENLPQILLTSPGSMERSRFWFFPVPLAMGDLRVSDTGRALLVNAGLQVLTEEQYVAGKAVSGAGQPSALGLRAAEEFNAALDDLESSRSLARGGIFAQLRGLTDIVTLATIWRSAGVDTPILERLAGLPIRVSGGDVVMPEYFPGVSTTLYEGNNFATVNGGVEMEVYPNSRSVDRVRDSTTAALEAAVANFPQGEVSTQITLSLVLPRAGTKDAGIDQRSLQAELAASAGELDRAQMLLDELTVLDPLSADNWVRLAYIEAERGRFVEARQAMRQARMVDPADDELEMLALDIELRADPRFPVASLDNDIRIGLAKSLVSVAIAEILSGEVAEARVLLDRAVMADPDSAEGWFMRSQTYDDSEAGIRDLRKAVGLLRRQSFAPGADIGLLKFAEAILLETRANQVYYGPDDVETKREKLQQLRLEFTDVRRKDSSDPVLFTDEVRLWLMIDSLYPQFGNQSDFEQTFIMTRELVQQNPDYAMAHFLLGKTYRLRGQPADAVAALNRSVTLDPTNGETYLERGMAQAYLGRCDLARADLELASNLGEIEQEYDDKVHEICA